MKIIKNCKERLDFFVIYERHWGSNKKDGKMPSDKVLDATENTEITKSYKWSLET